MTYIIGIKTSKSISLIADQAITTNAVISATDYSSFEEKHVLENTRSVYQSMFKVVSILDNVVATFAGDIKSCLDILTQFKRYIQFNQTKRLNLESIKQYLLDSTHDYRPVKDDRSFVLLVGFIDDAIPRLISYTSQDEQVIEHEENIVQFGSIDKASEGLYVDLTSFLVKAMLKLSIPEELILPVATGFLQSYVVHANLMEYGVGGAFVGVQLIEGGIRWQPNTAYFITEYVPANERLKAESNIDFDIFATFIFLFLFHGGLVVYSLKQNDTVFFTNSLMLENMTMPTDEELLTALSKKLQDIDYYIFLSANNRFIQIMKGGAHCVNYISIKTNVNGDPSSFEIHVTDKLLELLHNIATNIGQNQIGVSFISEE